MSSWDRLIEQKIREAIDEGVFDNLPGRGKPLDLDAEIFMDPEWRLAYRLLRSNNFTLPWIEARREIGLEIKAARAGLARAWARCQARDPSGAVPAPGQQEWGQAIENFRRQGAAINRRIADFNLTAPALSLHLIPLDAEREIAVVIQTRPARRPE